MNALQHAIDLMTLSPETIAECCDDFAPAECLPRNSEIASDANDRLRSPHPITTRMMIEVEITLLGFPCVSLQAGFFLPAQNDGMCPRCIRCRVHASLYLHKPIFKKRYSFSLPLSDVGINTFTDRLGESLCTSSLSSNNQTLESDNVNGVEVCEGQDLITMPGFPNISAMSPDQLIVTGSPRLGQLCASFGSGVVRFELDLVVLEGLELCGFSTIAQPPTQLSQSSSHTPVLSSRLFCARLEATKSEIGDRKSSVTMAVLAKEIEALHQTMDVRFFALYNSL